MKYLQVCGEQYELKKVVAKAKEFALPIHFRTTIPHSFDWVILFVYKDRTECINKLIAYMDELQASSNKVNFHYRDVSGAYQVA